MLTIDQVIQRYSDREVVEIIANEFYADQRREIIGIIFRFADASTLHVRLDEKGVGFIFEDSLPEVLDLGNFGKTEQNRRLDIDLGLPLKIEKIVHDEIRSLLCDAGAEIMLIFQNSKTIRIANNGDELDFAIRSGGDALA